MTPTTRRLFVCAAVLAASPAPAFGQSGNLACFARGSAPAKIAACTQTLADPALPPATRALALLARADAYVAGGDTTKALADYDAALAIDPDAAGYIARAKLHAARGEAQLAEADYSAALSQDAVNAGAFLGRAKLRLARSADAEALADLGEARRLAPTNTEAQSLLAATQLKAGQSGAAAAAFSATLSGNATANTDQGAALRGRATASARAGDFKAAVADFTGALKLNRDDIAALEGRGMAQLQSGGFSAAIADFSALLALRPDDPAPLFFRAAAKLQAGDANAAADYTTFLAARPGDVEALMGRALSFQFAGNFAAADADLSAILTSHPDAAQAMAARALVRFMRADFSGAVADLTAALSQPNAPAHLALWRFVAQARAGDGNATASLAKTAPRGPWPGPVSAYFLSQLSGDDLLAAAVREPASAPGRLCEAYFYLGEAALLQNDTSEAVKLFRAARETGMTRYAEYAAAKAELERLDTRLNGNKK